MNCIFCNASENFSREHIIPKNIGGSITINNVCVNCNSTFGSDVDLTLIKNRRIYDSYLDLSKNRNINIEFIFREAFHKSPTGHKIRAAIKGNSKETMVTKIDDNNFVLDVNDDKFITQYLKTKGKKKNLSDSIINGVIENYLQWNKLKKKEVNFIMNCLK